jgi:hypothetical protein
LFPGCPLEPIPSNHHVNQNCHRYIKTFKRRRAASSII